MIRSRNTRQRTRQAVVRLLPQEHERAVEIAMRAGLPLGAAFRKALLDDAGPRARRQVPVNEKLLRQTLGELGHLGGNLNQIAHNLNADENATVPDIRQMREALWSMREAIYRALNLDPSISVATNPREEGEP